MKKEQPKLTITITMKDGGPVPAKLLCKVVKNAVKALEAIEESKTGKKAELEWVLTSVKETREDKDEGHAAPPERE